MWTCKLWDAGAFVEFLRKVACQTGPIYSEETIALRFCFPFVSASLLSSTEPMWGGAVNSVLAIGGVGGLAIGLAGREILENLFTGLIILSSSPFEVGEEVLFTPASGPVRLRP